ncbi:MAG: ADP-glyceromanno-heptose 6-epimerase [Candidatus Omnitrophica bacterium]|nr:ADP-glyceromanno-heptose 6-epimerase [Candidatus Omnitrophota bacterium]
MIVLTGGAGFIGSCFLRKLNDEGITDILVVDQLDRSEKWRNLLGKKYRDYRQKDEFLSLVEENSIPSPKAVVHMGACSSTTETDSDIFIKDNYEYSKKLARWALSRKAPFLYASSAATYGNGSSGYKDDEGGLDSLRPLNMYGYSKHMFDLWAREESLLGKMTGIKFFNVFGPNEYHKGEMMSVICKKYPELVKDDRITLFKSYREEYPDGGQKRDFVYIKDTIEVMWFLFTNPNITGIYNLGSGRARSWNDLARAMFTAHYGTAENEGKIEYVDMPGELRPKYQYYTEADLTKLREAGCDHQFMSLEEAVRDYVRYLRDNSHL